MKKIYVYDFDGTIYDGDSSVDFFMFCLKKKPSLIFHVIYIIPYFIMHLLKIINITDFKERVFSFLSKLDDSHELVLLFWDENEHKINDFYKDRKHINEVVISASPYFLLNPLKEKYGFDLIGSDVCSKTGKFNKPNCRGEEKIKELDMLYDNYYIKEMYSDSLHDKSLLDKAEKSFYVVGDNIYDYSIYKFSIINKLKERYQRHRELYSYLVTGVLTTLINFGIYLIFRKPLGIINANVVAFIAAVTFAFIVNKLFVFKSKSGAFKESILFFTMRIITLLVETLFLFLLAFFINDIIAKIFVSVISVILNYIFSKFIIFKRK